MSASPVDDRPYEQRLASLRDRLGDAGVDALLVTHPPNLRYLCGFEGSLGALVVSATGATLIVDGRYIAAAREIAGRGAPGTFRAELADSNLEDAIARVVLAGPRTWNLGVEGAALTLSRYDRLAEALGRAEAEADGGDASAPRLRSTEGVVERGRIIKDASEVGTLREAGRLLSAVAREAIAFVVPGRSERAIAADVEAALRLAGFERPAFETIVASGPNGARPHARAGHRVVEPGDGVVLDFGGVYDGYCVDLTRTVRVPPVSEPFEQAFAAVRTAHAAALATVRPGIQASLVDRAARVALETYGLADAFVHGTGHGLGLEVHEAPRVARATQGAPDDVLEPGMVFTVEPGVYLAGVGGVRLEDDVLVVEGGCELLTDVPIDLESASWSGGRPGGVAG